MMGISLFCAFSLDILLLLNTTSHKRACAGFIKFSEQVS